MKLTTAELEELAALYAPTKRDDYLPASVQNALRKMRAVIDEVKMHRAGTTRRFEPDSWGETIERMR